MKFSRVACCYTGREAGFHVICLCLFHTKEGYISHRVTSLDTVAVVCQTAGGLFDLWEMIKKPSSGAVESEVREQTAASILDDAQRTSAVQANEDQVAPRLMSPA